MVSPIPAASSAITSPRMSVAAEAAANFPPSAQSLLLVVPRNRWAFTSRASEICRTLLRTRNSYVASATKADPRWDQLGAPGFGEAYKKAILETSHQPRNYRFRRSPSPLDNFVELDPSVKDIFGIPVLRIHMSDGENERRHDSGHG